MSRPLLLFSFIFLSATFLATGVAFFGRAFDYRILRGNLSALVEGSSATSSLASNTAASSTNIVDALGQLQGEEQSLADEVVSLRSELQKTNLRALFRRVLKRGNSGEDVKELQILLDSLSGTTSSPVSGFYGPVTERRVRDFQLRTRLETTGVLNDVTRAKLLELFLDATNTAQGNFVPVDLSSVMDPQQGVQDLQSQITELSSQISDTQSTLENTQQQIADIASQVSDLQTQVSNLHIHNVTVAMSAPLLVPSISPGAPLTIISNVKSGTITRTAATITWTTNAPSTSEVDYSSSSSLPANKTSVVKDAHLTTSHSQTLASLSADTTYYYRAVSTDNAGNATSSSVLLFKTSH